MLGIPMLGMVAAKTAIAKKIDKNARGEMQEAAPAVLKALGGIPRLKNIVGLDYDHTAKKFVSVKKNRGGYGKGTKKNNTK